MHVNQLGLYHILNAEGLLMLAETKQLQWGCHLEDSLGHLFEDFKYWCRQKKIVCSQRRWLVKNFHLMELDGPNYPKLETKAYNARVILAFVAELWCTTYSILLSCRLFHFSFFFTG